MNRYDFRFGDDVPIDDAIATLRVATGAVEAIVGETAVQLELSQRVDLARRTISIDGHAPSFDVLVRILAFLLRRQFGSESVRVDRDAPLCEEPHT